MVYSLSPPPTEEVKEIKILFINLVLPLHPRSLYLSVLFEVYSQDQVSLHKQRRLYGIQIILLNVRCCHPMHWLFLRCVFERCRDGVLGFGSQFCQECLTAGLVWVDGIEVLILKE